MTHRERVVKNALDDMRGFICGESKSPEAFDRFFSKLFRKMYDEGREAEHRKMRKLLDTLRN